MIDTLHVKRVDRLIFKDPMYDESSIDGIYLKYLGHMLDDVQKLF